MPELELGNFREYVKRDNNSLKELDSVIYNEISYNDFFKNYLWQNKPCIVRNISDKWHCQQHWIENGKPNFKYLVSKFGDAIVPVANCDERYFNAQRKAEMSLQDYVSHWSCYKLSQSHTSCLYLKDWHFMKEYPEEEIYEVPKYFASDWLNEYLLRDGICEDDYRFVYIGPEGSWTPFHADVFTSFSWSVNICGRKKWAFFQPGREDKTKDKFGKLPYSIDDVELSEPDKPYILIQGVGDAVFVPSGWYHQVWNIEDTISINHNWVNGCNIYTMWKDILSKLSEVEMEIQDCREMDNWDDQCQLLLKSVYGMDMREFSAFVFYIARVRLTALQNDEPLRARLYTYTFSRSHLIFDISALLPVFKDMLQMNLPSLAAESQTLSDFVHSIEACLLKFDESCGIP